MVCSHCQQPGHTYRRCPTITEEEKKEKAKKIKEEKEAVSERRRIREERRLTIQRENEENKKTHYEVINTTEYEIVMYWGLVDENVHLSRFTYIGAHSTSSIHCRKGKHRIVAFPFLEVCDSNDGISAYRTIQLSDSGELPYQSVFDMKMKDFEGTSIVIDAKYNPPKTELEEWKEFALKSHYLLKEIQKMTTTNKKDEDGEVIYHEKYENIDIFLKMIQDIPIPHTCTEIDKEQAGIPSVLTNIT